jgi:hypothetical protein
MWIGAAGSLNKQARVLPLPLLLQPLLLRRYLRMQGCLWRAAGILHASGIE